MAATIPIFDGENYKFWNVKMRTLFLSMGLWNTVVNGYNENNEEERQRDAAALSQIQQGVSDWIFKKIMNATKAKEAWDILQEESQNQETQTPYSRNRLSRLLRIAVPANISKSKDAILIVATLIATVTFTAVLDHLSTMFDDDPIVIKKQLTSSFCLTAYALIATLLAFITGTYAVLAPSRLSISVCVIPSIVLFYYLNYQCYYLPRANIVDS